MKEQLLTVHELSCFLNVHPKTVYKKTNNNEIPYIKQKGLGIRFRIRDIEKWLAYSLSTPPTKIPEHTPKQKRLDIPIEQYDKLYLKGESAVSKKKQRWNYGRKGIFIRKLKSGYSWCFWYYDESGKRKKETAKGATSREMAVLVMNEKVKEVFNSQYGAKQKTIKFKDFAEIYLKKYAKHRKQSWKTDEKFLNAQLKPFFGEMTLNDITPEHISDFVLKREKDEVKNSTINKNLQVLRKMMNLAVDYSYNVEKNPVRPFHFSSEAENRRTRILSYEEEGKLLKAASPHLKPIIHFALQTGCRLQEILRLKIDDVDFLDETITIRPENNKSGKLDLIPLPHSIEELLMTLIKENAGRTEFVFNYFDPRTNELRPIQSILHAFRGACRRADIVNLQFRDLRRTFGTRLHQNGTDPLIIQRLLRHSSFKISEQVYIQSSLKMMKDAVNKVNTETEKKSNNPVNLAHIWNMKEQQKKETPLSPWFSMN